MSTRIWKCKGVYLDGVVIGIRVGQTGYYELPHDVEADDMPDEIHRSFVEASMFGWHTPAAEPAINWLEEGK